MEFKNDQLKQYKYIKELGHGAQGKVYLVSNSTELKENLYALKVFYTGSQKRLKKEISVLEHINHPRIIKMYDSSYSEQEESFILMEYMNGGNLEDYLKENKSSLTLLNKLTLIDDIAKAVHHIHQQNIIHRDIKPSNIFIADDNEGVYACLGDFGILKDLQGTQFTSTESGSSVGTIRYLAPELLRGDIKSPTEQTDIYSLGVVLYETVTGKALYNDSNLYQFFQDLMINNVKKPSDFLEENKLIDDLVMKSIDHDRSKRYKNMTEFLSNLQQSMNSLEKQSKITSNIEKNKTAEYKRVSENGNSLIGDQKLIIYSADAGDIKPGGRLNSLALYDPTSQKELVLETRNNSSMGIGAFLVKEYEIFYADYEYKGCDACGPGYVEGAKFESIIYSLNCIDGKKNELNKREGIIKSLGIIDNTLVYSCFSNAYSFNVIEKKEEKINLGEAEELFSQDENILYLKKYFSKGDLSYIYTYDILNEKKDKILTTSGECWSLCRDNEKLIYSSIDAQHASSLHSYDINTHQEIEIDYGTSFLPIQVYDVKDNEILYSLIPSIGGLPLYSFLCHGIIDYNDRKIVHKTPLVCSEGYIYHTISNATIISGEFNTASKNLKKTPQKPKRNAKEMFESIRYKYNC